MANVSVLKVLYLCNIKLDFQSKLCCMIYLLLAFTEFSGRGRHLQFKRFPRHLKFFMSHSGSYHRLYDESTHCTVNFPSTAARRQSFPHPANIEEKKNHYITQKLRSNRGAKGWNPQFLTPLIWHSVWVRARNNLLIFPIKAPPDGHPISLSITRI